jgi:hypothetical protein
MSKLEGSGTKDDPYIIRGDMAPAGDKGNASKKDLGKPPLFEGCINYFPRALLAVALVSEYGDRKYTPPGGDHYTDGWTKVTNGNARYQNAELRHMFGAAMGSPYDDADSGLAHKAQKAWNALADLERDLRDGRLELRIGNQIVDGKPLLGTWEKVEL